MTQQRTGSRNIRPASPRLPVVDFSDEPPMKPCPHCYGEGALERDCWKCQGTGQIQGQPCGHCEGEGYILESCLDCEGVGIVLDDEPIPLEQRLPDEEF